MMEKHVLSKSTFIKGTQCEKALYLHKYRKELRDELNVSQEAIFTQGTSVGELACDLFPGGVDCTPKDYYKFQEAVKRTKDEIEKGTEVIYEAAFQFNGVLAALDILVKEGGEWKAYEVKSSTSVSDTYVLDASIQYYTIVNSGIDLKDISIVYINNQYVKDGDLDVRQLFNIESVLEKVQIELPRIPNQVAYLKSILKSDDVPEKEIGGHCSSPYACDFRGHCWSHVPEYSVFNITRLNANKKFELYDNGILYLKDIPDDFPLNDNQRFQVESEKSGEEIINRTEIRRFVEELNYPIYHLDYETFQLAVPVFDGTKPYQQTVFQYSLHIKHKDGRIEHKEYLAEVNGVDPRKEFVRSLLQDCGDFGDILVYNLGFEKSVTSKLVPVFPGDKLGLEKIISRLKDLMIPFQKRWYYTPKMQGRYSIKVVLPALVPDLSYKDLNIQEGGTASSTFSSMIQGSFNGDLEQTRADLLAYCKMDTWAMVKILEVLKKV